MSRHPHETVVMLKAYDAGHPTHAIAALYDMDHFDCLELLRRCGRKVDKKHMKGVKYMRHDSVKLALEVVYLMSEGRSKAEICRRVDLSPSVVTKVMEDFDAAVARASVEKPKPPAENILLRQEDVMAFVSEQMGISVEAIQSKTINPLLRKARYTIALIIERHGISNHGHMAKMIRRSPNRQHAYLMCKWANEKYEAEEDFAHEVDRMDRVMCEQIGERKII